MTREVWEKKAWREVQMDLVALLVPTFFFAPIAAFFWSGYAQCPDLVIRLALGLAAMLFSISAFFLFALIGGHLYVDVRRMWRGANDLELMRER